jgi:MFS family permease
VLLDERVLGPQWGWRAGFLLGAALSVAILLVRRHVPESPRWLLTHGRAEEAEQVVAEIERSIEAERGRPLDAVAPRQHVHFHRGGLPSLREVQRVLLRRYPHRSLVVLALMVSQAFFYNAIFFTYSLVLTRFHGVDAAQVGLYIFPFAAGNFLGPLLLGPLFDRIGRRVMISATYALSGLGLLLTGAAFAADLLDATTQTPAWSAVFFLASAAASSAYLTVSEVFPLEMRAISISLFYAAGTALGGFVGPPLYGAMIESGSRSALFGAYAFAAVLMLVAALVTLFLGVDAERKPLEEVCTPLGCDPEITSPSASPSARAA